MECEECEPCGRTVTFGGLRAVGTDAATCRVRFVTRSLSGRDLSAVELLRHPVAGISEPLGGVAAVSVTAEVDEAPAALMAVLVDDAGGPKDEYGIWQPPSPSDVDSFLEGGEHADKTFTNGADRPLVARKFREATEDIFGSVDALSFVVAGWGPRDGERFAKVLRHCTKVKKIDLQMNRDLGDAGVSAIAGACEEPGVLPELEVLVLHKCGIGDAGLAALTRAVQKGALPKLRLLAFSSRGVSEEAKRALREALAPRSPSVNLET